MKEEKNREKEQMVELGVSEIGDDATKYGEFVSSYFAWIPPQKQKEKAKEMQEMTEKKEEK